MLLGVCHWGIPERKVEKMKDEYWDELENTGRKQGIVTVALLLITILATLLFLLISCTENDKNVSKIPYLVQEKKVNIISCVLQLTFA